MAVELFAGIDSFIEEAILTEINANTCSTWRWSYLHRVSNNVHTLAILKQKCFNEMC